MKRFIRLTLPGTTTSEMIFGAQHQERISDISWPFLPPVSTSMSTKPKLQAICPDPGRFQAPSRPPEHQAGRVAQRSPIARADAPTGRVRALEGTVDADGVLVGGAQAPKSQFSGGVWSKSAAAASSSQASAAESGARAGWRGGALAGRPMQSRMLFAIAGSVMAASTRIGFPH